MAAASLGFTGRQKLLPFLMLQNTDHVSIWLPTAKRLHKSDIKKKKKKTRKLQTSEILKIFLHEVSHLKLSLKPSLKKDINFKKNYMIEKNTTQSWARLQCMICWSFWISCSL